MKKSEKENKELLFQGLRRCKRCNQILPISLFNKSSNKTSYLTVCQTCESIERKERYQERVSLRTYNHEYTCQLCGEIKPCTMFYTYDRKICKECKAKLTEDQKRALKFKKVAVITNEVKELYEFLDLTLKTYGNCFISNNRYAKHIDDIHQYARDNFKKKKIIPRAVEGGWVLTVK